MANGNPIEKAVDAWLMTGKTDDALIQSAERFISRNPNHRSRQDIAILKEIRDGQPRLHDGETQRLFRLRQEALGNRATTCLTVLKENYSPPHLLTGKWEEIAL